MRSKRFARGESSGGPDPGLVGRIDLPTSLIGSLLVLLLVALHILNPPIVEAFRLKVFDELQTLHPRPPQSALPVAIVDIDDASMAADRPVALAAPGVRGAVRAAG